MSDTLMRAVPFLSSFGALRRAWIGKGDQCHRRFIYRDYRDSVPTKNEMDGNDAMMNNFLVLWRIHHWRFVSKGSCQWFVHGNLRGSVQAL